MAERIAYFITSHGFGHAARAVSVMSALAEKRPQVAFDIFTTVPEWFFSDSLVAPFTLHAILTDIGLVQQNPFQEDLPETLRCLDAMLPFEEALIENLASQLQRTHCRLVLCDIAPLGIAAALKAGIPSVLVENFTWDWIYSRYPAFHTQFLPHINYLQELFSAADYHILAEPYCYAGSADLVVRPISRSPRKSAAVVRKELNVTEGNPLVILTMGGILERFEGISALNDRLDLTFVIPGSADILEHRGNIICLPHRSQFYHPDLIQAGDVVIGKVGYSTLAEVFHAGIPFGYIPRQDFPESESMVAYISSHLKGKMIPLVDYRTQEWLHVLDELLQLPVTDHSGINGAEQVAAFLSDLLW